MILSRLVKPRASRTQDMVASVPLLTMRTFSIDGIHEQMSCAISTSSGLGIPKLTPRPAAARTASIRAGTARACTSRTAARTRSTVRGSATASGRLDPSLRNSLLIGAVLVIALLLVALRDWRGALVSFSSIPLALLTMIAMEPPSRNVADAIRDEKLKVLRSLKPFNGESVGRDVVRGQYRAGSVDGKAVAAFAGVRVSIVSGGILCVAGVIVAAFARPFIPQGALAVAAIDLGKLTVFSGVREFPVRVKCATLPWHTLKAALAGAETTVSTELTEGPKAESGGA